MWERTEHIAVLEKRATSLRWRARWKQEGARTSTLLTVGKNWAGTRSPTKHETYKPRGINRTEPEQTQTRGDKRNDGGMLTRGKHSEAGFWSAALL